MTTPLVRVPIWLLAAVLLVSASCSSSGLHPVSGKVTVKNKPAVGARVIFFPDGASGLETVPSSGTVKEDGSFLLSTGSEVGAPAGKYVVTVVWPDPNQKVTAAQKMMALAPEGKDLLGGRYATREKSTLRAEVKPGENQLEPFLIP